MVNAIDKSNPGSNQVMPMSNVSYKAAKKRNLFLFIFGFYVPAMAGLWLLHRFHIDFGSWYGFLIVACFVFLLGIFVAKCSR